MAPALPPPRHSERATTVGSAIGVLETDHARTRTDGRTCCGASIDAIWARRGGGSGVRRSGRRGRGGNSVRASRRHRSLARPTNRAPGWRGGRRGAPSPPPLAAVRRDDARWPATGISIGGGGRDKRDVDCWSVEPVRNAVYWRRRRVLCEGVGCAFARCARRTFPYVRLCHGRPNQCLPTFR